MRAGIWARYGVRDVPGGKLLPRGGVPKDQRTRIKVTFFEVVP